MDKSATKAFTEDFVLSLESKEERAFLDDADFVRGLHWGIPRVGHPEGMVLLHIQEVFHNIDLCTLTKEERRKLRLVALVHDTFKYKEDKSPYHIRDWKRHHSVLAGEYMKSKCKDSDVIKIIALHDEAYYAWRHEQRDNDLEGSQFRLDRLLHGVKDFIQLYYTFFVCDTLTGDKTPAPIKWFEQKIPSINRITLK